MFPRKPSSRFWGNYQFIIRSTLSFVRVGRSESCILADDKPKLHPCFSTSRSRCAIEKTLLETVFYSSSLDRVILSILSATDAMVWAATNVPWRHNGLRNVLQRWRILRVPVKPSLFTAWRLRKDIGELLIRAQRSLRATTPMPASEE